MYNEIPEKTIGALTRYRDDRVPGGGFLHAVLANDLAAAFARADSDNLQALGTIINWLNWELPASSWGSYRAVEDWLNEATENSFL